MRFRALDRGADAARDGDVIVLDQHGVVEAEAVIAAAAGADRIFLERAKSRRRLAGADDAAPACPATAATSEAVARRNAAQVAEKIQRCPFGVNKPRAGPSMVAMTSPGATTLPSGRSAMSLIAGRRQLKGAARRCRARRRRQAGAPCRTSAACLSAGTIASAVMSPARPRSSSRAVRTSGSYMIGRRGLSSWPGTPEGKGFGFNDFAGGGERIRKASCDDGTAEGSVLGKIRSVVAAAAFLAPVSGDGDHQSDQRRIGCRAAAGSRSEEAADGASQSHRGHGARRDLATGSAARSTDRTRGSGVSATRALSGPTARAA